jgi:phosphopantothenoylcysteine decarboxylase / phosphopantothenate---cysteine ligase
VKARNKQILITAGPTREFLDPVRFLSNPSSGKMGYAIAEAARNLGCSVDLVSGPTFLECPTGMTLHPVVSAQEMLEVVARLFEFCDYFISVAAVSDWSPKNVVSHKIKKSKYVQALELIPTSDILRTMSLRKHSRQTIVGFCAETEELEINARRKLADKHLDWIAGNLVGQDHGGFQCDENELMLINRDGRRYDLGPGLKIDLAGQLLDLIGIA